MADCLFCRIIRGEVPSKKVYEDEQTFAFEDLNPQGPTHVLVIPKRHIAGLKEAAAEDAELVDAVTWWPRTLHSRGRLKMATARC